MTQKKRKKFLNEKNVKITKQAHAFKGFASNYNVEILNSFNPELQLIDTESAIKSKLIELSTQLKNFKFVATLVLVFKKIGSEDKTEYHTFYLNSKPEIIINESDIHDVFQSIYTTILSHCVKIQIRSFFWFVFSCFQFECRKIRTRKNTFHAVSNIQNSLVKVSG